LKVIARSRNVVRKDPYFRLGLIKQDDDDNKFVDMLQTLSALTTRNTTAAPLT